VVKQTRNLKLVLTNEFNGGDLLRKQHCRREILPKSKALRHCIVPMNVVIVQLNQGSASDFRAWSVQSIKGIMDPFRKFTERCVHGSEIGRLRELSI
jgi:hypothetical protein